MTDQLIISASAVVTMDPGRPRASAVAVDTAAGTIIEVGSLEKCRSAAPGADENHLGDKVLLPGFIEWIGFRDAVDLGLCVSFHDDGSVSPPLPLLNIQAAVTRRTKLGALQDANQADQPGRGCRC